MTAQDSLTLPLERLAVVIGKGGQTKKQLEEHFACSLQINSQTGKITISCSSTKNPELQVYVLRCVLTCIGLGHNPTKALLIEDEEYYIHEVVDVRQFMKKTKDLKKVMGRIIGEGGKVRTTLMNVSNCDIAIANNQVSVIGSFENTCVIRRALQMIAEGSKLGSVYAYVEENKV